VRVYGVVPAERSTSLETDAGPVAARWVLDAGGGSHWLARRLRLTIARLTPRLLCWYGYVHGDGSDPCTLTADPAGWTWIAEVRPALYQWTRLSFDASAPALVPISGEVVQRRRAADVTWRWVPACAGRGYVLVGDAAVVLDPTSARGVLRALMTGMKAAHVVLSAEGVPRLLGAACHDYREWLGSWVRADADEMRRLYARLPRPPAWAVSAA
jgi:2-polyprenyl-6-methoxyphenol hydroxylase-like FAD-dependent oxidoreductase